MSLLTYMSVLSTNNYLPGALVVNKCLKLTNVSFPFTILVTNNISEKTINILNQNNINTIKIDSFFFKNKSKDTWNEGETKWYYTFSKLSIFAQTDFEKIVYIDLDMLITENLDHLFGKKHFSAVNAGGFVNIWRDLNSGLLVFNPSKELFNELINILENGSDWEGDQDILQKYDTKWSDKKELNLGYQYNMFVTDIIDAKNCLSFTIIENIKEINNYPKSKNNIKVVHYAYHKPWDEPIGPYDDMYYYYKLWYDIYNTIQIK